MAYLNGSGVATVTSSNFHDIGPTTITARFNGNAGEAATSASQPLTINGNPNTVTLQLSSNSIIVGGSLTMTATVKSSSGTPITYGTVTFYNHQTTQIGMAYLNGSGVATVTSSNFHDIGPTTITARFNGNAIEAATSASQPLTINGNATTTAVLLPQSTYSVGSPISITAGVTENSTGTLVTYGNVTFFANGSQIGVGVLNSSGRASMTTSTLPKGSYTITARFNGSATEAISTGTGSSQITVQ
jgi:hypothetical protein